MRATGYISQAESAEGQGQRSPGGIQQKRVVFRNNEGCEGFLCVAPPRYSPGPMCPSCKCSLGRLPYMVTRNQVDVRLLPCVAEESRNSTNTGVSVRSLACKPKWRVRVCGKRRFPLFAPPRESSGRLSGQSRTQQRKQGNRQIER